MFSPMLQPQLVAYRADTAYNILIHRFHNDRRLQSLRLNQIINLTSISISNIQSEVFVSTFTEKSQATAALQ